MNSRDERDGDLLPDPIFEVTEAELTTLRDRLVETAGHAGLLDIAYRTIDSPIGPLLIATTEAGIVRIAFEREDHDAVLVDLATEISPRILRTPRRTDQAARQLDDYFHGRRQAFDLDVDIRLVQAFRRKVISALRSTTYGSTVTYASLADAAGSPRAVRAVGSACANNPVPIVVPCHRVTRSDGSIGQYLGGTDAKAFLLSLEGSMIA